MKILEKIKDFLLAAKDRFTVKIGFLLVVAIAVISLGIQYFSAPTSVPFLTILGTAIVPFQTGMNEIGSFFYEKDVKEKDLAEATKKIQSLEEENEALRREISGFSAIRLENETFRSLLKVKEKYPSYDMVAARVIGNDGVNVFRRFTINVGSADGITVNMNVINEKGLIGIITYVGYNYSIVESIIEDGMNVAAQTKIRNANCIVQGDAMFTDFSSLHLINALANAPLEEDSTIVTSDISDKFLPGFLIGYVTEVTMNPDNLTKNAIVKTAVDFSLIRDVLVVTTVKEPKKEEAE